MKKQTARKTLKPIDNKATSDPVVIQPSLPQIIDTSTDTTKTKSNDGGYIWIV